jgi:ferredoxin
MAENRLRKGLVSESTRAFIREARQANDYSFWDFVHGYVYARWPYLYIGIGTGEHRLAKTFKPVVGVISRLVQRLPHQPEAPGRKHITFADTYHGKVVPLAAARQLVEVKQDIRLPDLETIIPYARARDIILKNPDHIVALDCPCRVSREKPCLPLDVCLIVGEPFASFVQQHQPDKSRWITQEEAVGILQAEDERGHVHHAFLKDAMLGRFYAICNCCSCCCGAMQAHFHGTPMLTSSGYVSQVDPDLCIGCGVCVESCQFSALSVPDGIALIDQVKCMGCGVCVGQCSQDALSLVRAPARGEPLEIQALMQAAGYRDSPTL